MHGVGRIICISKAKTMFDLKIEKGKKKKGKKKKKFKLLHMF